MRKYWPLGLFSLWMIFLVFIASRLNRTPEEIGIYPHTSGQAVYIEGSACTINMDGSLNLVETTDAFVFCNTKYMEYLASRSN